MPAKTSKNQFKLLSIEFQNPFFRSPSLNSSSLLYSARVCFNKLLLLFESYLLPLFCRSYSSLNFCLARILFISSIGKRLASVSFSKYANLSFKAARVLQRLLLPEALGTFPAYLLFAFSTSNLPSLFFSLSSQKSRLPNFSPSALEILICLYLSLSRNDFNYFYQMLESAESIKNSAFIFQIHLECLFIWFQWLLSFLNSVSIQVLLFSTVLTIESWPVFKFSSCSLIFLRAVSMREKLLCKRDPYNVIPSKLWVQISIQNIQSYLNNHNMRIQVCNQLRLQEEKPNKSYIAFNAWVTAFQSMKQRLIVGILDDGRMQSIVLKDLNFVIKNQSDCCLAGWSKQSLDQRGHMIECFKSLYLELPNLKLKSNQKDLVVTFLLLFQSIQRQARTGQQGSNYQVRLVSSDLPSVLVQVDKLLKLQTTNIRKSQ